MNGRRSSGFGKVGWTLLWVAGGFCLMAWLLAGLAAGTAPAAEAPQSAQALKNPFASNADAIKEGEKMFDERCSECHGGDAMGMSGPDLTDDTWIYGGSDTALFSTVAKGRTGGMPSWSGTLKEDEIWKVIAYIRSLKK